jgi:copper homeostasis protein
MSILLEIIATAADDCAAIEQAGGDRIELCSALTLGGLTPSAALVQRARETTQLPIMMMLRPRAGGFCYSAAEFTQMALDLKFGLAAGVDGFVFGCLNADGTVDQRRTAHLVKLAAGRQTVFHRAFDVTPDPFAALESLIALGVTRILTSGQQPTAWEGADLIQQLVERAAGAHRSPARQRRARRAGRCIGAAHRREPASRFRQPRRAGFIDARQAKVELWRVSGG